MILLFTIQKNFFEGLAYAACRENEIETNLHSHEFLELVYICAGTGEYRIGTQTGVLQAGDYFVVDYETYHEYFSPQGDLMLINCLFRPEIMDTSFTQINSFNHLCERYFLEVAGRKIKGPTANQVFHDDGDIGVLCRKFLAEYEEQQEGYIEILRCILCEIIVKTVRRVGSERRKSAFTDFALQQIENHFAERLTLQELCAQKHFSVSYASARFEADMGMTFTNYLQSKRIEAACRLLTTTALPVTEIAMAVGYGNIRFFNKIFKKVVGIPPLQYRKKSRDRLL